MVFVCNIWFRKLKKYKKTTFFVSSLEIYSLFLFFFSSHIYMSFYSTSLKRLGFCALNFFLCIFFFWNTLDFAVDEDATYCILDLYIYFVLKYVGYRGHCSWGYQQWLQTSCIFNRFILTKSISSVNTS